MQRISCFRRAVTFFIVILLVLSALPTFAFAASPKEEYHFYFPNNNSDSIDATKTDFDADALSDSQSWVAGVSVLAGDFRHGTVTFYANAPSGQTVTGSINVSEESNNNLFYLQNIAKEQLWNNCLVTLKANRSNYGYVYYVGGNFQP